MVDKGEWKKTINLVLANSSIHLRHRCTVGKSPLEATKMSAKQWYYMVFQQESVGAGEKKEKYRGKMRCKLNDAIK